MTLPDNVITKLEIYMLACRELMERLEDLQLATQTSTRVDIDKCLKCSDGVLNKLFKNSSPKNLHEAAKLFGNLLRAEIDLFRSLNNDAAAIFDDVITAVQAGISSWHYYEEFQKFHADGRQLAQRFFTLSSHT
jgi:hypothetical protein